MLRARPAFVSTAPMGSVAACTLPLSPRPVRHAIVTAPGRRRAGILNAPATGLALAELIVDGKSSSVDLRPFDPAQRSVAPRAAAASRGAR